MARSSRTSGGAIPPKLVASRPRPATPSTTLGQLQATMPPASPAVAPTLRQVIADLKLADPDHALRDELKALLAD